MGKPFPCDLQTLQAVHKQKLLEEFGVSNALRAHRETQDCHLNSGDQVVLQPTGCQGTVEEQRTAERKRFSLASQSVRLMLSMLPPIGETTKMKPRTSPRKYLAKTQVASHQVLCVCEILWLRFIVWVCMYTVILFSIYFLHLFISSNKKEDCSPLALQGISERTEGLQ